MIDLRHARTSTTVPGQGWRQLSDAERLELVIRNMPADAKEIVAVAAKPDGQIIVSLTAPMPASRRGTMLFDVEAHLHETIDPGLVVWLEPLGDRNSLRNLRGIEVK